MKQERRQITDFEAYFNRQLEAEPVYLKPGETVIENDPRRMIVATVGSGVIMTVHDRTLKIGAAAYILLPKPIIDSFPHFEKADAAMLAEAAKPLEVCMNEMKHRGAGKNRIHMWLIGGARLPPDDRDMGTKNYVFVREHVTRKNLPVLNEDWGGTSVRRVHFFPATGRAVRLLMRREGDMNAVTAFESGGS